MKKFIKKTIAGLIAGVMAISSMPFTALAADSYNAKPATSFNAKTGTATVYWEQSTDKSCTGYYNNLLYFNSYSEKTNGTSTANTGNNYCYTRAWYPTMVFLYDGVNDSYAPVMGTASKSDMWGRYLNYFVPMDNNDSNNLADSSNFYCDHWTGIKESVLDYTKAYGGTHHGVRASISDNSSSIFGLTRNTFYPHSSKLHVSKTVNFEGDEGYSHAQQIWWFAGSHTDSGKAPASGDKNFGQANKTTYVVNYKPLYDAATEAAKALKTFDETIYTVDSVNAYYTAINAMYDFDPNSYFKGISEANVATQVSKCAQEIKTRVGNYTNARDALTKLPQIEQSYKDSYNNALAEAEEKAKNTDGKYTEDSIAELNTVIADVKNQRGSVKTNEELDKLTTSLLTAISNLVQTKFTVEFVKIDANGHQVGETVKATKEYGQTFEANAEENVKGWIVYTDNGATMTRLNTFDQVASVVITKDAKIEAYLSGEETTTTSSKVTFLGRHNQVVAIKYVAENQPLDTSKVEAPKVPFYSFVKWDVASVTGDGKEYTVKAIYTCEQVEENEKCTVHFGDWHKAYAYDNYVYLPNTVEGKKYALYSDAGLSNVLTVLDGVDFYAPKRSDIYVGVYDGDDIARVAVMGTFSKIEGGTKSAYYNCKFNLPEGATAIEWGVELKYTDKNGNVKYAPLKAELKSKRNEYTSRLDVKSASVTGLTVRAYVVYSVKNNPKQIVRSAEETVTFNA